MSIRVYLWLLSIMSTWRDEILQYFTPQVSRLTLAVDPDDLLTEELLAVELRQRGFDVIDFTDPVAFRYVYERRYRSIWDRGADTLLLPVVRVSSPELDNLPFDLLRAGRCVRFNLGSFFPHLSYPVLETVDRKHLDAIFAAQVMYAPQTLGDAGTKDFLLRCIFGIVTELINTAADLLHCLLRCHYKRLELPDPLSERLIELLRRKRRFGEWPLEQLVKDSQAFFHFLQERWPLFLNTLTAVSQVKEQARSYPFTYPGPDLLPFDHHDVCAYIDTLFLEERLTPVELPEIPPGLPPWVKTGIKADSRERHSLRTSRRLTMLRESLPDRNARYSDWLAFAMSWGELSAVMQGQDQSLPGADFAELWTEIDTRFDAWLRQHYAGLVNLPPAPPAMAHHISRYLAREFEQRSQSRLALLVIDGLSFAQWITLRQTLSHHIPDLLIRESAVFAWIPTLTSVSRQAIFAGKAPIYFAASIGTTEKEPALWRHFWENAGLPRTAIAYQKVPGDGNAAHALQEVLHPGRTQILGLVLDKVDKIMHGMQLGAAGMHNQIRQWGQSGFLASLIAYLLDGGYQVWLTSDHGNLECTGQGRITEGVLAETRGERVRIYSTPELISPEKGQIWTPIGLPGDYYPLLAPGRSAFISSGATTVAHGGTSIEEVIVPFVKFERRQQ